MNIGKSNDNASNGTIINYGPKDTLIIEDNGHDDGSEGNILLRMFTPPN